VEIRRLVESDWEQYRTLRLESLMTDPDAFGADLAETQARPPQHWMDRLKPNPNAFMLGAWDGDRLVGMVGFRRDDGPKDRHKGLLFSMYVSPGARRSGTGRQLVTKALEEARQMEGLVQVDLMVVAENEPAVRLYQSIGFITYGREPRALKSGERYLDEYLMVYFLDGYQLA
jgi:ribosomal protein S18 acetylase RimI-like enzyme